MTHQQLPSRSDEIEPVSAARAGADDPAPADDGAPAPPRPHVTEPRRGQIISKKYRLDRLIARGGMGAVWAGMDLALERPVAIKFMDAGIAASESLRSRFNREAKAAAQLRTPYVVQIHEHGVHLGLPYIVMELLEGEDLHARLKRERRLPLTAAARILTQAAKALKKAHALGIVHRDLKPQNIFLADQDDETVVKILDFGIAKRTAGERAGSATKTGQVLGSPHYMSPEQARGLKNIDHRSDIWSMGVILYRTVTGRKAFTGEATGDVIVKICTDPVAPASFRAPGLPESVDRFFERALARDPNERFQSAMEMAQTFAEIAHAAKDVALFTPSPDSDPDMGDMALTTPVSNVGLVASPSNDDTPDSAAALHLDAASGPGAATDPAASLERVAAPPAGATPVELTPAPMSGPTGPSLATPSVVDVAELPLKRRSGLPWLLGAAAVLVGGVAAFAILGPSEPTHTAEDATSAVATEPPAAAVPAPEPPAEEPNATTEPSTEPAAAASASATAAPKPAVKRRPPPRRRPPKPASTPTTKRPAWGY